MANIIQVCLRMNGKVQMLTIRKDSKISELFDEVRKQNPEVNKMNLQFYLLHGGELLDEISLGTIDDFGIVNLSCLELIVRLQSDGDCWCGGLKPLPGRISVTAEPCCITYDDDPKEYRAKMPCQCVISTEAMKNYAETEIANGRHKFKCPNCSSEWQFFLVRHVLSAIMSQQQLTEMSLKINDNYFGNTAKVQKCPSCDNYCEREDQSSNHVRCTICTNTMGLPYEFCWACLGRWKKKKSTNSCGNSTCYGKDSRIRYLEECATKTIGRVSGVPSVRKCEKCGNLINHSDACKHMTCKCGYSFCFVCLKPKKDGDWQCGQYSDECPVAPRQISL